MKASICTVFYGFLLLLVVSCGDSGNSPETAITGKGDAVYSVTFNATWSESTHPTDFPDNAHFSPLVGATHNMNVRYWNEGELASPGIESMAETGGTMTLVDEMEANIAIGDTDKSFTGGGLASSPGTHVISRLPMSSSYSFVTVVTMLAPSPDWFAGVSGVNLMEGGVWVESKTVDLYAWDAGTDDGATFWAADADTNPRQPVVKIMSSLFMSGSMPLPIGQMIFQKEES